jgi:uncharacterized membrane protein
MQEWLYGLVWRVQEVAPFVGVLVAAALVAAIVALIRGLESQTGVGGGRAMDALNKRYTAGKISFEEYEEGKQKVARAG